MRSLREYIRLYFMIESQYIKEAECNHRSDFIISSVGMFFPVLPHSWHLLGDFDTVPNLAGWSLMEMVSSTPSA
ncbi:MAG: hypothetical protein U0Z26_15440 [Anaerolineales bacterium]